MGLVLAGKSGQMQRPASSREADVGTAFKAILPDRKRQMSALSPKATLISEPYGALDIFPRTELP